eukprot:13954-Heterococcus_DN1.PRE.2
MCCWSQRYASAVSNFAVAAACHLLLILQLEAMPYFDAVVSESMRVHLVASPLQFVAIKDAVVGGITIAEGTGVYVCQGKTAASDEHFTNAKQFWPEVRQYSTCYHIYTVHKHACMRSVGTALVLALMYARCNVALMADHQYCTMLQYTVTITSFSEADDRVDSSLRLRSISMYFEDTCCVMTACCDTLYMRSVLCCALHSQRWLIAAGKQSEPLQAPAYDSSVLSDTPFVHDAKSLHVFGGGPRLCPGKYLGLTEVKVAVVTLLQSYNIALQADHPVPKELVALGLMPDAVHILLTKL